MSILKIKLIRWMIGIVLGVPLTIAGAQWMMAKTAIQQVNCINDGAESVSEYIDTQLEGHNSGRDIYRDFDECRKNIDPHISTPKFVKNQYDRLSH